jgi:hypothetical protein
MTYPPKIPDYIYLYATLKRLQDEIDRAIPEFQELLSSSKWVFHILPISSPQHHTHS